MKAWAQLPSGDDASGENRIVWLRVLWRCYVNSRAAAEVLSTVARGKDAHKRTPTTIVVCVWECTIAAILEAPGGPLLPVGVPLTSIRGYCARKFLESGPPKVNLPLVLFEFVSTVGNETVGADGRVAY